MTEPSSTEVTHTHNWTCSGWYADLNMRFRQTQNPAQPSTEEEQAFPNLRQQQSPALPTPESLKLCPLFWGNRGPQAPLDPRPLGK